MAPAMIAWVTVVGWMWHLQEWPLVPLADLPPAFQVKLGKKRPLRQWLMSLESLLNQGKGDQHLSQGEFALARALQDRRFRQLRRWESFAKLQRFLQAAKEAARCRQTKATKCPPWPKVPAYPTTFVGRTKARRGRVIYRDSRYARLCRRMASGRIRQRLNASEQRADQRARKASQKRLKELMGWIRSLPHLKKSQEWVAWLTRAWKRPSFRNKLHKVLGYTPTKRQLHFIIKLLKRGKQPDARSMMRLSLLALRSPLLQDISQDVGAMEISGLLIWGGDKRPMLARVQEWRRWLQGKSHSCQRKGRGHLHRRLLCGTTLKGAKVMLSKSTLLNHFARSLMRPFWGYTYDEMLRSCLARRLGKLLPSPYGQRCFSPRERETFWRLLVRTSLHRYEPYGSARSRALNAIAHWRPKAAIPCLYAALHPRREPKSYVRKVAIWHLPRLAVRFPSKRRRIIKYLRRSANPAFDKAMSLSATIALAKLNDTQSLPTILKYLHVAPHACQFMAWRRYKKRRIKQLTYKTIPRSLWLHLREDPWHPTRPLSQRTMRYRLVQCGDAPLAYVQEMMQYLQPKKEPSAALRKVLWDALLKRYLYLYRSRLPPPKSRWWPVIAGRMQERSAETLYRKKLLVYLQLVGLRADVEKNPSVREQAQLVTAALKDPNALRWLSPHTQLPKRVRRALKGQVKLWPYHRKLHISKQLSPRLLLTP